MGAELILYFDGDFLDILEVIGEDSKGMDSLMSELILLLHIVLVLNLDDTLCASIRGLVSGTLANRSIKVCTASITAIEVALAVHRGTPFPVRETTTRWTLSKLR